MNLNVFNSDITTPQKTHDTAVTGHSVALGLEFGNRTCTYVTHDQDTAVLPVPVSHPN